MTMVTVGGVRYREETAKKLGLTADSKAYAAKVADNTAPVGVTEAQAKAAAAVAAGTTTRKAAGGGSKQAPSPTTTGTADGGGDGTKPGDPNGNGGKPADGK